MEVHVRAFRRADDEVVVGVGSAHPQLIRGLTDREARTIVQLGALSPAQWQTAHSTRPPSDRWPLVLELMAQAARLAGASTPPLADVAVIGDDVVRPLVAAALAPLARSVIHDPLATDRLEAAVLAGETLTGLDAVVLLEHDAGRPSACRSWQAAGTPHLLVRFTCDGTIIGPLVRERADPCTHCLDLHRQDHDPTWARIAIQCDELAAPPARPPADLVSLAAGLVGSVLRGLADGNPLPAGMTISARAARTDLQHQRWSRHPRCPRHRAARSPLRAPA